jgi:hypothetical protein
MSTLARAKARFEADRFAARRQAIENLRLHLALDFNISGWGEKAREAFLDQWSQHPGQRFAWDEVFRRHNDPDRLDVAIWGPNGRLCGLGLGLTTSEAVEIRFMEGDPRPNCPLKGRRILIVLECAACYAQARGRTELRIQPINEHLETLYRQTYGFVLETAHGGERYYRRGI